MGGQYNGAWLASRDGTDVVLKPLPPGDAFTFDLVIEALSLTAAIRSRGYPAPRHDAVVTVGKLTVTVQELVDGIVQPKLDLPIAQQLVELMKLQADIGRSSPGWTSKLAARVRPGDARGQQALLESDDSDLRAIVAETREVANATWQSLRSTDVIHADLHGGNVLVSRDVRIAAVVDWEGARVGDWRWNLAMLAWFHNSPDQPVSPEAAEFLRQSLEGVTDRSVGPAALAITSPNRSTRSGIRSVVTPSSVYTGDWNFRAGEGRKRTGFPTGDCLT